MRLCGPIFQQATHPKALKQCRLVIQELSSAKGVIIDTLIAKTLIRLQARVCTQTSPTCNQHPVSSCQCLGSIDAWFRISHGDGSKILWHCAHAAGSETKNGKNVSWIHCCNVPPVAVAGRLRTSTATFYPNPWSLFSLQMSKLNSQNYPKLPWLPGCRKLKRFIHSVPRKRPLPFSVWGKLSLFVSGSFWNGNWSNWGSHQKQNLHQAEIC